jgi:Zn-dependent M28 family amino/carboxypeptidase
MTEANDQEGRMAWVKKCRRPLLSLSAFFALLFIAGCRMVWMPGDSYKGDLPALSETQSILRDELEGHVRMLAEEIGPRNVERPLALSRSRDYLVEQFKSFGYAPSLQTFTVDGVECSNVEVEIPGASNADDILVIGAHYDSAHHSPGANDNASAVAAILCLAKRVSSLTPARTIRFVAFVNEEPPRFQTAQMGSMVYAEACREKGEQISMMLSLDTIGYFDTAPGSQHYPWLFSLFYPDTGNFIAFVSNTGSRSSLHHVIRSFRNHAEFPSEGVAAPGGLPGIGWSDHWSFWKAGYPAVMITDTAPFRYPYYHSTQDTVDKIDFDGLSRIVTGLEPMILELASDEP